MSKKDKIYFDKIKEIKCILKKKDKIYIEQLGEQAHKKQGSPAGKVDQHIHIVKKIFRSTDFSAIGNNVFIRIRTNFPFIRNDKSFTEKLKCRRNSLVPVSIEIL